MYGFLTDEHLHAIARLLTLDLRIGPATKRPLPINYALVTNVRRVWVVGGEAGREKTFLPPILCDTRGTDRGVFRRPGPALVPYLDHYLDWLRLAVMWRIHPRYRERTTRRFLKDCAVLISEACPPDPVLNALAYATIEPPGETFAEDWRFDDLEVVGPRWLRTAFGARRGLDPLLIAENTDSA